MDKIIKVSKEVHKRLKTDASDYGTSIKEYVEQLSLGTPEIMCCDASLNEENVKILLSDTSHRDVEYFNKDTLKANILIAFSEDCNTIDDILRGDYIEIYFKFKYNNNIYSLYDNDFYIDFHTRIGNSVIAFISIDDFMIKSSKEDL